MATDVESTDYHKDHIIGTLMTNLKTLSYIDLHEQNHFIEELKLLESITLKWLEMKQIDK